MGDSGSITLSIDARSQRRPGEPIRQPHLIVALECSRPTALSARYSLAGIHTVHVGRGSNRGADRRETAGGRQLVVRVPDRWMSSSHARIEHSFGRWVLEDTDSKNGTIVNGEPVRRAVLQDGDIFELGHTVFLFCAALAVRDGTPPDLDFSETPCPATGLATLAPALDDGLTRLQQVARSPISILIQGDSGTGKEVTARAAHHLSGREGEFVAVNCGAIPANLVESELFGYRKGAFSGAVEDRPGLVRSAHRGTLFLDEIGDLPTASQAALLRVLQEREVTPVGGVSPVHVDLRVIAATNRDIDGMVASEDFRRDLFARLAGFRIELPPLARRLEDFGLLVGTLTARVVPNASDHPGFECDAIRQMLRYDWPLNIRELEQCIRTASVLAGDNAIACEHLPESVRNPSPQATPTPGPASPPKLSPEDEKTRDELVTKLREHSGNISAVARDIGKDRKQIQRWLKRFQIDATDFR